MPTYVINISHGDEYDVYVGRGTIWGNPYHIGKNGSRDEVIAKYEDWIQTQPELIEKMKKELTGRCLGCYCAPLKCHGDIIVRICDDNNE